MVTEKVVVKKEKNTTAVFECIATGYPRPTIHWSHHFTSNSHEQSMNDETSDNAARSTLTLINAHPVDSGMVRCYAVVNPGGNVAPLKSETVEAEFSVLSKHSMLLYSMHGLMNALHTSSGMIICLGDYPNQFNHSQHEYTKEHTIIVMNFL